MVRALAAALTLAAAPAAAGTVLRYERAGAGDGPTAITLRCEGGSTRFEGSSPADPVVIYDAPKKTLNLLKVKEKTYSQLTEADIAALRARAKAMMEQVRDGMAGVPAAQRAQIEAMIQQYQAPGDWQFIATGKRARVGKWDCELYEATRGGTKTQMCLVPWSESPVKKEDLECLKGVVAMMSSMGGAMVESEPHTFEFSKFPGMPVQSANPANGSTATLRGFERVKVPPGAFVVPSDYKRVPHDPGLE